MSRHKLPSEGWRAFSVAAPSVWNSSADYLRDPAFGLNSFRRHLKAFLLAHCKGQLIKLITEYL